MAKRVFQSACIVVGAQETQPSLSIKYTGRDAKKVFQVDLLRFSRIRSPMLPQLRSFNDSDIPMIVFHDELIPAKQVIEGAKNFIEVACYLKAQGDIAHSNLLSSADSLSLDPMSFTANSNQLWIRPKTGQICLGPDGPTHPMMFSLLHPMSRDSPDQNLPLLPLSLYNNLTFLDRVVKNTPSSFVLGMLSDECTSTYSDLIADYDWNYHVLLSFSRQPVARFAGISWSFSFSCLYDNSWYTEEPQRITMEDRRIRLTILNHRISWLMFMFNARRWTDFPGAWLSQAAHVFNVLGTPREEWEDYALFAYNSVTLKLKLDIDHTYTSFDRSQCEVDMQIDRPECYLFVLPPPQLPDTRPDVAAWCRMPAESLYYWSLDPTGDSEMPEAQRIALGLPRFYLTIGGPHRVCWKAEFYDLIQQWQKAQGFDPTTTDFARSMGKPILEILPQDDNRFEDCVRDDEGSKPEPNLEGMEVDGCFETSSNSQDSSLSQEYLEESSPMDVDTGDCSDLMADLHIEVAPMDE
ncbi:hypothetical protein PQX77_017870 [Marasmius sp. AFHP31]|nr:hypothetical protein PQX77_017870 [Marasmius sp. AFHP31]